VKRAEIVTPDVEAPIAVEQANAAPLGELAAETEILTKSLLLKQIGHDRRVTILPLTRARALPAV